MSAQNATEKNTAHWLKISLEYLPFSIFSFTRLILNGPAVWQIAY